MEMDHFLTHSGLTYPEVSSNVCHGSFCQLASSVSLPWVTYYEAFYLHVLSSFSCIPVICPKLVLFLIPLQFVYLFCTLSPTAVTSDDPERKVRYVEFNTSFFITSFVIKPVH